MLSKRIIACLDIMNGNLAKSVNFINTKEIGDPVEAARKYYDYGIDELVLYDITASVENRTMMLNIAKRVAEEVFIPFSVGGGLKNVNDCFNAINIGAEKVNVNSAAVKNPQLISQIANRFGSQCVVLSMDVLRVAKTSRIPSGYEIVINGGRINTGIDAVQWAIMGKELGAGELVINSIDADGTKNGYNIPLTKKISEQVSIPVIASGGGGIPEHLYEVLTAGGADAALVASMLHYNEYSISEIKTSLINNGLSIRML